VALDDGQGPKAVVLQLEEPVGMVEGLRRAEQRHGAPERHHDSESTAASSPPHLALELGL
jgi:hypothetical protein